MKKIFLPLILLTSPFMALSQQDIKEISTPLITSEQYDSANKVIDRFIKANPKNPDGYVMKGNVIFYRYSKSQPGIALNSNIDESIYEESGEVAIEESKLILPADTANAVTAYLEKALLLDKTRQDIYAGCCYIYSMSLQVDKLSDMLDRAKKNLKTDSTTAYSWSDYARNMLDRNAFDEGMKVYRKIADLFPDQGGTWSDISAEYYRHGDLKEAKECADKASHKPYVDAVSYRNVSFIYGVLEDYTEAIETNHKAWQMAGTKDYLVYEGLLAFMQGKDWKTPFKEYAASVQDSGFGTQITGYMLSSQFDNSMTSYNHLTHLELSDAYKILIHKYYKEHTPYFGPAFNYAECLTYNFRYNDAVKAFDEIKTDTITKSEKEDLLFYSAWACYKADKQEEANKKWEQLLNSDNFFHKSAAAYFLGMYYYRKDKNSTKANDYFRLVADDSDKSKYAGWSKEMLDRK